MFSSKYIKISFKQDIEDYSDFIFDKVNGSSVLVIGGAGTIGSNYIKKILRYRPSELVVVDVNALNISDCLSIVNDLEEGGWNIQRHFW